MKRDIAKVRRAFLIILPALLGLWVLALMMASPAEPGEFADRALEQAVRIALARPEGKLPPELLEQLTELDAEGAGIRRLDGIERLSALRSLNLRNNQIEDITLLAGLPALEKLNLRDNRIADIRPLSTLTMLRDLNLRNNQIADLTPLAALPLLQERLYLSGNPIADYGPISAHYDEIADRDLDLSLPVFSHRGGFYEKPFRLALTTVQPGANIRYTLDGSEPTAQSPRYTGPIDIKDRSKEPNVYANIETTRAGWVEPPSVFKGTVVRAAVFTEDGIASSIVTQSYFVHPKGGERFSLPVISLATDGDHFFDYETGIYVPGKHYVNLVPERHWENPANYTQSGREWERPVSVEMFETGGVPAFALNAGVRIHGNATTANPNKSLRLYFRKEYGAGKLEYPLFPDRDYDKFDVIVLRTSGNDHDSSLFRDALMHRLLEDGHTRVDALGYRPAVVFLNGEYWGIHNIRERGDQNYIAEKYGMDEDEIDLLEFNAEPIAGDADHYHAMIQYLGENNIREPRNYAYIRTQMDIDNFIDYQIAQIYYNNTDWPGNNIRTWRERTPYSPAAAYGRDGRWRWIIFDTDFGFGLYGDRNYMHDTLAFATAPNGLDWPNPDWSTFLLRTLLQNDDFRAQFASRFADHLNSTFAPGRVVPIIESMKEDILLEITEHIRRWGRPYSIKHWGDSIERMKEFAEHRPAYMRDDLDDHLLLGGQVNLRLDDMTEGGIVKVGSIEVDGARQSWEGIYYRDLPVELTAVAKPGYRFAGWQGDTESPEPSLSLHLDRDMTLTPVFEKR